MRCGRPYGGRPVPESFKEQQQRSLNVKLISAFGAADMLELDRQTVRRALRQVSPDGYEKNQPRWRMKTIIAAVDRHLGRNRVGSAPDQTALQVLFDQFDSGC